MSTKLDELKSLRIDDSHRTGASEPKWSRRWILTGISILVLLGIVATVYRLTASSAPEVEVTRAVAESSAVPGVILNASGYIVAHHKINVNSKVTGRVAWVGVEKGDKVKEGQVVVRLEDQEFRAQAEQARGNLEYAKARLAEMEAGSRPEEIARAQHDYDQAKAMLIDDKANLDRIRPLVAEGVLSRQALDDAIARYEASVQRVNSLQRTYDLAKLGPRVEQINQARAQVIQAQGQLAYAQSQLDATQIRAPVSGTILERTAEKGELITAQFASTAEGGPQGSVVALADLNDLQVELDIAQQDFAKLSPKQKGTVTTDAFPDRKYNGVIAEISPEANRQKATVQVKVQILNPDGYLRPDMNANVQFLSEEKPGEVMSGSVVPSSALRDRSGRKIVFVAYNGRAVVREVKILGQRSDGYLVEGLTGGELLLSNAPPDLKDGDRVRIKSSK
ncbi:MAG TPA: efflux RND transporter periplasmic adaptor subunit [Terriglobales bacterium]|nr:efflux RND transporter periplasmic adaptor subunit [Terriglobales bacterium]